jgi:hypothetical protein
MDKRTTNRYRMLLAAQEVLSAHEDAWTETVAMQQAKFTLDATLNQVKLNLNSVLPDGKLATANKKILKRRLANKLQEVKGKLRMYAAQQQDEALVYKLRFSPMGKLNKREVDFLAFSSDILERAEGLLEFLPDYGLSEAQLQEVWQLHRQFHDTISSNRVVRKKANRIKAENRALVRKAIKVLEYQIDEFIPSLESEAPELFGEYQRVRLIDDY